MAAPCGTGRALGLTLSRPAASATARAPPVPGAPQHSAPGAGLPRRPFTASASLVGPQGRPDKEIHGSRGSGRRGPAVPAWLPPALARSFTAGLPPPAKSPPPGPDPFLAPRPPLRTGPARSGGEAAARPGRGGGGGRHHVCPPLPEAGCQRTMRGGGAGGAGAQADPADPRGISGARSPGNPAP